MVYGKKCHFHFYLFNYIANLGKRSWYMNCKYLGLTKEMRISRAGLTFLLKTNSYVSDGSSPSTFLNAFSSYQLRRVVANFDYQTDEGNLEQCHTSSNIQGCSCPSMP